MKLNKNENISYFDIDDTLAMWDADPKIGQVLTLDFYGIQKEVRVNRSHVEFLKSLKARGHYIIVHSGNGWKWAETVVKAFELNDYVDEVQTKGCKFIDDQSPEKWANRVYVSEY